MKNNKGFSLVELIIVIAIMAILVGVMAPQLIKYIEKTNQSADIQLCDSVKTAVTTAIMDPDVARKGTVLATGTYTDFVAISTDTDYQAAVKEIMGGDNAYAVGKIKSKLGKKTNKITVQVMNSGATVEVYIDDLTGTISTQAK